MTLAACRGHLDVVQYLAGERGAAVDHAQADGATALIAAACNGYLDVVRYLAGERGAAVDYLGNNANFSQKRNGSHRKWKRAWRRKHHYCMKAICFAHQKENRIHDVFSWRCHSMLGPTSGIVNRFSRVALWHTGPDTAKRLVSSSLRSRTDQRTAGFEDCSLPLEWQLDFKPTSWRCGRSLITNTQKTFVNLMEAIRRRLW